MNARIRSVTWFVTVFSATANVAVGQAAAPPPADRSLSYQNVELTSSGHLPGQVINKEGIGLAGVSLEVTLGNRKISTTTDKAGRFMLPLKTGGTCLILIGENTFACRAWKQGTAPPKSIRTVALINETSSVVRGNRFRRRSQCPPNCQCPECRPNRCGPEKKYGLAILAAGGVAAYMALSRDNASN